MKDILAAVLGWVSTPWRAAFLLLLAPLAVVLAIVWEVRGQVASLLLDRARLPVLSIEAATREAPALLAHDVVAVIIYRVLVYENVQIPVVVVQAAGDALQGLLGRVYPLVGLHTTPEQVRSIMAGASYCFAPSPRSSEHVREMEAAGIVLVCGIPVPTSRGEKVGLLHLAWQAPPSETERDAALVQGQSAVLRMLR